MNEHKIRSRIIRALFSRFLCLIHIGFSIFVLFEVKNKELIYLIPLFGAVFLVIETFLVLVFTQGKEPTNWFSPMFFIYVGTIVSCYWLLELENIKKSLAGKQTSIKISTQFSSVNSIVCPLFQDVVSSGQRPYYDFNKFKYNEDIGDITTFVKVVWSTLEIQIFFALLIFVRWIIPKSNLTPQDLAELLTKYFVISCDMLDFLTILQDDKLIKSETLVMLTLSVWSWSTFQFFIYVPSSDDEEKKYFSAYVTNSLLSVIFMDLPYMLLRLTAIFGFGAHNYNSYYFVVKNVLMILLSCIRIRAAFRERKMRSDKNVRNLKDRHGIDRAPTNIFNRDLVAQKSLSNRFKNEEKLEQTVRINLANQQSNLKVDVIPQAATDLQFNRPTVSPRNHLVNRLLADQNMMKMKNKSEHNQTLMNPLNNLANMNSTTQKQTEI